MQPVGPNSGLMRVASDVQELARYARQQKWNLAFQSITAINMVVLTGAAGIHLWRDIRRAERESGRGR